MFMMFANKTHSTQTIENSWYHCFTHTQTHTMSCDRQKMESHDMNVDGKLCSEDRVSVIRLADFCKMAWSAPESFPRFPFRIMVLNLSKTNRSNSCFDDIDKTWQNTIANRFSEKTTRVCIYNFWTSIFNIHRPTGHQFFRNWIEMLANFWITARRVLTPCLLMYRFSQ